MVVDLMVIGWFLGKDAGNENSPGFYSRTRYLSDRRAMTFPNNENN
jgi:hypothetical protein